MLTRYFFNPETNTCESFFYGGCMGNKNNFIEKNDCLKTCGAAAAPKSKLRLLFNGLINFWLSGV